MNVGKRTILYLVRKWSKTLLLFMIFLVVGTLVISGVSIRKAADQAASNVRQSLGGGFVMKEDHSDQSKYERRDLGNGSYAMAYVGESLTKEIADKVAEVPGVSGYNAENIGPANLKTMDGEYLKLKSIEGSMFANEPVLSKQANIYGYTNTAEADMFTGGSLELIEGRQITSEDHNAVLIHKELAESNNLKLGDQFVIAMNPQITGGDEEAGKLQETVTIVGIFDSRITQQVSMFSTPGDLLENTVLMDVETSVELLSWSSEGYYKVHYQVDDPAKLDSIMEDVRNLDSIDWDCFTLAEENKSYESAALPLDNLGGLITTLIVITTAISVAILVLLLTMWTKSRTHETGILLSIGISKAKILMQHLAEVLIVAVLAFSLSFFASTAVAQGMGNALLDTDTTNSVTQEPEIGEDGSFGYTLPEIPTNTTSVTELTVTVVPQTLFWVFGIGGVLIIASVTVASIPIFRLKPKELLGKMD